MDQTQNTNLFQLNLDSQNSYMIRSVASWAKVLGFVSIIFAVLCIIGGIMFQQIATDDRFVSEYRKSGFNSDALGNLGMAMYILIGIIFGLSGLFALNAGNKINTGLRNNNIESLNSGFANARNFFALWAILMILMLVLVLLGIVGSLGGS